MYTPDEKILLLLKCLDESDEDRDCISKNSICNNVKPDDNNMDKETNISSRNEYFIKNNNNSCNIANEEATVNGEIK